MFILGIRKKLLKYKVYLVVAVTPNSLVYQPVQLKCLVANQKFNKSGLNSNAKICKNDNSNFNNVEFYTDSNQQPIRWYIRNVHVIVQSA